MDAVCRDHDAPPCAAGAKPQRGCHAFEVAFAIHRSIETARDDGDRGAEARAFARIEDVTVARLRLRGGCGSSDEGCRGGQGKEATKHGTCLKRTSECVANLRVRRLVA